MTADLAPIIGCAVALVLALPLCSSLFIGKR